MWDTSKFSFQTFSTSLLQFSQIFQCFIAIMDYLIRNSRGIIWLWENILPLWFQSPNTWGTVLDSVFCYSGSTYLWLNPSITLWHIFLSHLGISVAYCKAGRHKYGSHRPKIWKAKIVSRVRQWCYSGRCVTFHKSHFPFELQSWNFYQLSLSVEIYLFFKNNHRFLIPWNHPTLPWVWVNFSPICLDHLACFCVSHKWCLNFLRICPTFLSHDKDHDPLLPFSSQSLTQYCIFFVGAQYLGHIMVSCESCCWPVVYIRYKVLVLW